MLSECSRTCSKSITYFPGVLSSTLMISQKIMYVDNYSPHSCRIKEGSKRRIIFTWTLTHLCQWVSFKDEIEFWSFEQWFKVSLYYSMYSYPVETLAKVFHSEMKVNISITTWIRTLDLRIGTPALYYLSWRFIGNILASSC